MTAAEVWGLAAAAPSSWHHEVGGASGRSPGRLLPASGIPRCPYVLCALAHERLQEERRRRADTAHTGLREVVDVHGSTSTKALASVVVLRIEQAPAAKAVAMNVRLLHVEDSDGCVLNT